MLNLSIKTSINLTSKRYLRKRVLLKSWPNDWVPFVWNRPEHRPGYLKGGDLEGQPIVEKHELKPGYDQSSKLKELDPDDPVRRIFSLDHACLKEQADSAIKKFQKQYGIYHEVDHHNSLEAKIIRLTFKLRGVIADIATIGPDKQLTSKMKVIANSMMSRRYRYLCDLKEIHGERFRELCDKLNIEPKENLINKTVDPPHRKLQMRKLALQYAIELKEKKVEEYIESLIEEKAKFEKEKLETLKWIEEQEKKLNELTVTN